MSPTKLKARPIDNKNKMPHSFKLLLNVSRAYNFYIITRSIYDQTC